MVIVEFRVPLPLTVDQYNRGQLHMTAEKSLEATQAEGGGGGIEILINEPYDNTDGHWGVSPITGITVPRTRGQYTLKRYHLKSKFPAAAVALLPSDAVFLIEEAWNAYPHCRTVLVNGYLDTTKFRVVSTSAAARGLLQAATHLSHVRRTSSRCTSRTLVTLRTHSGSPRTS